MIVIAKISNMIAYLFNRFFHVSVLFDKINQLTIAWMIFNNIFINCNGTFFC